MSDATSPPATRSPSLIEAVRLAVRQGTAEVNVALPGRVERYDATTQKADVKPLVKRRVPLEDGDELLEPLPIIPGVPVVFQRSGDFFLSFPLQPGDFVLLVFCSFSIDKWLASSGDDTDPDDFRMHDLSDAVAIPGLYPNTAPLTEADALKLVLGKNGGAQVRVGDVVEAGTAVGVLDFVALAQKVATELGRIQTYATLIDTVLRGVVGPTASPGAPDVLWTALKAAILATPYPAPASVAATKLKAE